MIQRMLGAVTLRSTTFEEVEADQSATKQALFIVALSALAASIGNPNTTIGFTTTIPAMLIGLFGWAVWAWITYLVGTKLLGTTTTVASWSQLARTLGFAQSPGVFKIFGWIPIIGPYIFITASVLQLAAMIIAIRQALDYTSTLRAIAVAIIGFIPYLLLMSIPFVLLG
jgi:hypothetical protein